jgi:DNA-binding MarR family transcriptional regulator/N-acetylglutamate synthase-like GNAT family acetyltransferase
MACINATLVSVAFEEETMTDKALMKRIDAVRQFNRFYTQKIGVLREGLLSSPFSLTEVRVLYELAHRERPVASELGKDLALNPGYLSRILSSFKTKGFIDRKPSDQDGRQSILRLTEKGKAAFAPLNERARDEIGVLLGALNESDQINLVEAMESIKALLSPTPKNKPPYLLRPHQPGDMGWVVHLHGMLYAQEYGWDDTFEALVAGIVAKFIQNFEPKRERCWIAEIEGEIVGSVFLVKESETVSKLRLLLVHPKARGLGMGKRMVNECIRFAKQAGYRKTMLWTNNVLLAARHIYEAAGFKLVLEEPHHSFGHDLVGETWELEL